MAGSKNLEAIALRFVRAVGNRKSFADIAEFYHPDVKQIEFPNAVTKTTAVRSFADLKKASDAGQKVITKERLDVIRSFSSGNTVIVEAKWTGTLAIPLGKLPVGGEMTAHFAQFFEFKDDKIIEQRNYDCFDPFN